MEKIKSILKGDSPDSKPQSELSSSGRTDAPEARNQKDFMSSASGKHSTSSGSTTGQSTKTQIEEPATYETQDERTAPAVQHETVSKLHEDRVQQVVDKDKHTDHYHTTVQPLTDRVVEPTSHRKQQAETQYRQFDHDDAGKTRAAVDAQAAQFKNKTIDGGTSETTSTLDTVGTESVHHHMHETVQPVIHKETVQPSVTHTTIPIQEVHHGISHIHEPTVAKPMSIDEFNKVRNVGGSEAGDLGRGN